MENSKQAKFFGKHTQEQVKASKKVNNRYPKFSFEFCFGSKRGVHKAGAPTKKAIFEKIIYLSQKTWEEIKYLPHEQGFEKIEKSSFYSLRSIPAQFKDVTKIDVFRLPSKIGRLIGYIEEDTFFIVWIDTKFNMYDH